jgi:hypothetical protein
MAVPLTDEGTESYYDASIVTDEPPPDMRRVNVQAVAYDDMGSVITRDISFVKIDVEGHELQAVSGMRETIERNRPALLIEVATSLSTPDAPGARLHAMLADLGYAPYVYDETKLGAWRPGMSSVNYFFLQAPHLVRLRESGLSIS